MRIVLFGPPGVGKGTQANLLTKKYNLVKFSSGDLLREEVSLSSPVGKKVEQYLKKGHLVPDDVMFEIVDNILIENQNNDVLFDGFPRTLNQARSLEKSLAQLGQAINVALEMYLATEEIVDRLVNRRYCPKCGNIYNYLTRPPKNDDVCDVCKYQLMKRDDDNEDIVRKRLRIYEEETRPLTNYYKSLRIYKQIDAKGTEEEVFKRISDIINGHINKK